MCNTSNVNSKQTKQKLFAEAVTAREEVSGVSRPGFKNLQVMSKHYHLGPRLLSRLFLQYCWTGTSLGGLLILTVIEDDTHQSLKSYSSIKVTLNPLLIKHTLTAHPQAITSSLPPLTFTLPKCAGNTCHEIVNCELFSGRAISESLRNLRHHLTHIGCSMHLAKGTPEIINIVHRVHRTTQKGKWHS